MWMTTTHPILGRRKLLKSRNLSKSPKKRTRTLIPILALIRTHLLKKRTSRLQRKKIAMIHPIAVLRTKSQRKIRRSKPKRIQMTVLVMRALVRKKSLRRRRKKILIPVVIVKKGNLLQPPPVNGRAPSEMVLLRKKDDQKVRASSVERRRN